MRKLILGLIVVVLVIGLAWYVASIFRQKSPEPQVGSVTLGGEMFSTSTFAMGQATIAAQLYPAAISADGQFVIATTTPFNASSSENYIWNSDSRKTAITLGSVIIASSSVAVAGTNTGRLRFFNATSTTMDSNPIAHGVASSTGIVFDDATVAGTYTFDTVFDKGLIIELEKSFSGNYIVTWR